MLAAEMNAANVTLLRHWLCPFSGL